MSVQDLMSCDCIQVLTPALAQGLAGEVRRTFTTGAVLKCRVTELDATDRVKLQRLGYEASHRIRFAFDPQLSQSTRIRFPANAGGIVMRITPAKDSGSVGVFWTMLAKAHTEDNQLVVEER